MSWPWVLHCPGFKSPLCGFRAVGAPGFASGSIAAGTVVGLSLGQRPTPKSVALLLSLGCLYYLLARTTVPEAQLPRSCSTNASRAISPQTKHVCLQLRGCGGGEGVGTDGGGLPGVSAGPGRQLGLVASGSRVLGRECQLQAVHMPLIQMETLRGGRSSPH